MSKTETMIAILENEFPQCWFKDVEGDGVITSGEGSVIDEMEAFNYNGWADDPQETIWQMGVNKELVDFVEGFSMYWECQDPGTYKLYAN